jgi:beta-fructofuranosidase
MLVAPPNLITWDFWTIVDNDGLHHLFFLQAPRDNYNPEARHNMAEVGHAVSKDLTQWEYRGKVIQRGKPGSWNDVSIWTGSVVKTKMGDFLMMITGRSSREGATIQRLGVYYSKDLYSWSEYSGNPVLECDPKIFEPHHHIELSTTWRDPCLYLDDESGKYFAFITAQKRNARYETIGAIALATSNDGTSWSLQGPLDVPEYFRVMECPQLFKVDGSFLLLFHIDKSWVIDDIPSEVKRVTGSHYLISDSLQGPFRYGGLLLDGGIDLGAVHRWNRYQLRIHDQPSPTQLRALFWEGYQNDGSFSGGISSPCELLDTRGLLR